jgi:UDP-GlcNAc:undecaprenyl-phosphate GlcNAc-1-phosphate transferase
VIVASINFYNFIDGIDGLAAGSAFISSLFLALVAWVVGQPVFAVMCLAVSGAALGFLQFNFPPSRLFMGDSGSTFFGYVFAYLAVAGNHARPEIPLFVPFLLLSSLYLDAGLTVINRLVRREKLFQPHRTHYYQRLLQIGLNHKQVTLLEYLVTILLGASALLYVRAGQWFAPFLGLAWAATFVLLILKIRGLERGDRMIWERRTVFVVTADLLAIVVAFVGAYFLRMNFQFTDAEGKAVLRALPIVVIVRSACFFKFGLYRSMWRYTTTGDVVRVIKAVTVGSGIILAAVVLLYRFVAFPRSLFVIEYVMLISLILGTRFSTRLFHEIGRESHGRGARRFGVIGAGDAAERAAREIKAGGPNHAVLCFVDDDPANIGLFMHGVPVEGPGERLEEIRRRHRLDVLVYAPGDSDDAVAARWIERAHAAGLAIDAVPGAPSGSLPPLITMDRVAGALKRHTAVTSRAASVLRGRRALITHGATAGGATLAHMLRAAGAVPVLHTNGPARPDAPGDAAFCTGSLLVQADTIVCEVKPDVVFHRVVVEPRGAMNDDAFLWDHLVAETLALAGALWRHQLGGRVVVMAEWGGARCGDRAAAIAAVMEAALLSRAGAESVCVLRMPRVLASEQLVAAASRNARFDMLDAEAVRDAMELAAGGFRGIYVPSASREFSLDEARAAAAGALVSGAGMPGRLDVFPGEHVDECGIEGIRRVLGPLFPAADPFRRLAAAITPDTPATEREAWLQAVAMQLYRAPAGRETVYDDGGSASR